MVLCLPHPLRCTRKDFRGIPCKYVPLVLLACPLPGTHFFTVPNPVLGGVTTFLFASVVVSGLRVLSFVQYTRRDRFILAAALSFGLGDLLVPDFFNYLFAGVNNPNNGLQGLLESISIVLTTPCKWTSLRSLSHNIKINGTVVLIAGLVAVVLNLVLGQDISQKDELEIEEGAEVAQDLEIQMLDRERRP